MTVLHRFFSMMSMMTVMIVTTVIMMPMTFWGRDLRVIDVNLDLSPKHRWDEAYKVFKPKIPLLAKYYREQIAYYIGDEAAVERVKSAIKWSASAGLIFTNDTYKEIKGIAALAPEMDVGEWLLFNIGYEFSTQCTAIAVANLKGVAPYMLRNLDWESEALYELSFVARFTRNGKEVARGPTFFGLVGLLTGVAPGRVAIAINYRKTKNGAPWYNYISTFAGSWPSSILLRHVLLSEKKTAEDYQAIVKKYLMSKSLIAPCYFIVVGTKQGEGTVISRGRYSANLYQTFDAESGVIVQTNIDPTVNEIDEKWANGDPLLLNAIERRDMAYSESRKAVANGELPGANILETSPVDNFETLYHAILSPSKEKNEMCQAWQ